MAVKYNREIMHTLKDMKISHLSTTSIKHFLESTSLTINESNGNLDDKFLAWIALRRQECKEELAYRLIKGEFHERT